MSNILDGDLVGIKVTAAWGREQAQRLIARIDRSVIKMEGKRVLDFGCAWGYMCAAALDEGAKSADGVDIIAPWQHLDDPSVVNRPGLSLHKGNILELESIQQKEFDVILSSGTLFLLDSKMLDDVLLWFYRHLRSGGRLCLTTRTFAAKSFNDLGTHMAFAGAQLLFSRRVIDNYLELRGHKPKHHLAYTCGTFALACRAAGFEILKVVRMTNNDVLSLQEDHSEKVGLIDSADLATSEIQIYLQYPGKKSDVSSFRIAR